MPTPRPTAPMVRERADGVEQLSERSVAVEVGERLAAAVGVKALGAMHRGAVQQHVVAGGIALDRIDAEEAALARQHALRIGGEQRAPQAAAMPSPKPSGRSASA